MPEESVIVQREIDQRVARHVTTIRLFLTRIEQELSDLMYLLEYRLQPHVKLMRFLHYDKEDENGIPNEEEVEEGARDG